MSHIVISVVVLVSSLKQNFFHICKIVSRKSKGSLIGIKSTCYRETCTMLLVSALVVKSFIQYARYILQSLECNIFFTQDPIENFFGCQCQRRGAHESPNIDESAKIQKLLK